MSLPLGVLFAIATAFLPGFSLLAAPAEGKTSEAPAPKNPPPRAGTAKKDWSDLQDNELKLFGSDKEEKIPLGLKPIAEIEDWKDPKTKERYISYKFAWIGYWTVNINQYPNFNRTRFLLYSNLESKTDNRRETWFFPLYYFRRDGDEQTTVTPLTYHFSSNREEIGFMGPLYNYRTRDETRRYLLPLVYYGEDRAESSSYLGIFPLFYGSSRGGSTDQRTSLLTPLFYHSSKKREDGRSDISSISPLHFYKSRKDRSTFGLPIIPFLFYRHQEHEEVHYNMALLFDSTWKSGIAERLWAFPLLFYQRGDEGYLHVVPPLFISFQDRESSYTHLFPLYFHRVSKQREIQAFPIYFYTRNESDGTSTEHRNLLWLFDWVSDNKLGLRRFAFIPFFFYNPGPEKYLHVLPPFYMSFGGENWSYRHLLPLAFRWRDGPEEIDFYWLYSRFTDGRTDHHNVLGLLDMSFERGGGLQRLWTIPFAFYRRDSYLFAWLYTRITSPESTFHNVLGLLNVTTDRSGAVDSLWILPLYFQGKDYRHVAPLYFSWQDESTRTVLGPGYYYSRSKQPTEAMSLLLGPLWIRTVPEQDRVDTHLLPLSFLWRSKTEFTWFVLPALAYVSFSKMKGRSESAVYWPLWFYSRNENRNEGNTTAKNMSLFAWLYYGTRESQKEGDETSASLGLDVSPLYVYRRTAARTTQGVTRAYRVWFPILPLFFRSYSTEEGSHTNALYIADWKSDSTGTLQRFWGFPLVFYGRNDYLYAFPFFVRPFGGDAEEGWSGGLLHYHSWSKEHDRLWLALYYGAHHNTDKSTTTVLFPFYYDWVRDDSKGNIVLPLRIQYEDRQKFVSIWFFGGSSSQQSGALTANIGKSERGFWYVDVDYSFMYNLFSFAVRRSIFAPARTDEGTKAAETSMSPVPAIAKKSEKGADSQGKAAATVATADPVPAEGVRAVGGGPPLRFFDTVELEKQSEARKRVERGQPAFSKRPDISRETARDFWGVTLLFGMFAYQEADTETHVRVFPLAWLTWDERYKDKVTAFPFYFHYERGEECNPASDTTQPECARLVYTVLFPLYGHQRVGRSHITAYGLLLYMNEFDDETKESSHSVLWPIFHKYDSPSRDGFRFFPLVWHRNTHEENKRRGQTTVIAPLLYHTSLSVRQEHGWEHSTLRINPLEYYSRHSDNRSESELVWRPIVPLYVSRSRGVLTDDASSPTIEIERSGWSIFFPVAVTKTRDVVRKDRTTDKETTVGKETKLFGLPLLYYGVSEAGTPESRARTFFLLGYYNHRRQGHSEQSVLFGLFRKVESREPYESSLSLLYGLVRFSDGRRGSSSWLLPFYYGSSDQTLDTQRSVSAIPALLSYYSETNKRSENERSRETAFVSPVFMRWTKTRTTFGPTGPAGPGESKKGPPSRLSESTSMLFPLLPLPFLYRSAEDGRIEWDWLLLFHLDKRTNGDVSWRFFPLLFYESGENASFTVFPLFWSYTNPRLKERAVHVVPPLFMSWRRPHEWSVFIAGLYLQSSAESSRQNFLFLIDQRTDRTRDEYVFGMVFDFFRVRGGGKRSFEVDVAYGLLFGLDVDGPQRYDWNLLWMMSEKRPGRFESSFIPFWWYESRTHREIRRGERLVAGGGTEWNLWLLPLTYISVDTRPNRGDTYFLLGGIYFRSEANYSRQNFYFLFDHYKSRQQEFWGVLFHAFSYEKREDHTKFGVLYRLLGGMDYRNSKDYDFNILWYVQYQDGSQFNSIFLPLWYYTSDADSSVLVVPPLLAYASRDRGGVFQMVGLGTLWYRNYDASTLEDSRRVLLGALYEEQSRAANGFHSVGSVWGFLWQYQSESETGYRKFSVLRLPFYRKVRRDGQLRTYILGIPTN